MMTMTLKKQCYTCGLWGHTQRNQPYPDVQHLPWHNAPWLPDIRREEKQCYTCGLWGHTQRNCYQEHPELHPANRQWVRDQMALLDHTSDQLAYLDEAPPSPPPTDTHAMDEDLEHPFELNMIMQIDNVADSTLPRSIDLERCWLIDSGASSHYIQCASKYRSYEWLVLTPNKDWHWKRSDLGHRPW